jgi:prepilin-type N-terminal cleavage/methylation domain-containing protein
MRTTSRGFTLIEVIMVIVLIGTVAAIALPRIGVSRYQANAAARAVTGTLSYAQRTAISQQANINVAFDAARRGMRVHEDRDNDLNMDPGERVTFTPLAEGMTFGRGGAAARPFGGADIQLTRQQDGLPVLIFRRDGTLSEEGGIYLSTISGLAVGRATDVRAVDLTRATGRATWFTYATGTWKRGD